jgi:hypothetical protein
MSDGGMILMMKWGLERKQEWPIFKYCCSILPLEIEETHENCSKNSWPVEQELNCELPKYEADMLCTQLQCLVTVMSIWWAVYFTEFTYQSDAKTVQCFRNLHQLL